jgi:PAS domain S-box-containing protein
MPYAPLRSASGSTADDSARLIRLRRRSLGAVVAVVPAASAVAAVVAVATETPSFLAWTAVGAITTLVAVAQIAVVSNDLRIVAVAHAVAVLFAAQVAPPDSVPGVVAGSAIAGSVMLALMGRRSSSIAIGVILIGVYSWIMFSWSTGASGIVGVVAMVGGGAVAWVILAGLLAELREGDGSYRHLFDRVPVGLYRTAPSGVLVDANHALGELLGYSRDEVIGMNARDLLYDPKDLDRLRAALGDGLAPLTTDLRFRRRDGEIIWIRDRTRAVTDDHGRAVFFEGELQDVTEERRHLEELEALVRSKSELIGAVSHELRTPLTAVVGSLDLLAGTMSAADAEQVELLTMAVEQSHEVAGIVEDLLTAARIDNHELLIHPEPFDVAEAVEAAIRSMGLSEGPTPSVSLPEGTTAFADAGRVRQILRNLLSNASRYGRPPVRVGAGAGEDGTVVIVVSDQGAGISDEIADKIFDAFFSGATVTSQPGAIGLGLSVSRKLARLMDGDLDYRRVGGETQFVLRLPMSEAAIRVA